MMADAQSTLQLRDIHLPAEPGWWPPAPGWWLLGALIIAAVIFVAIFAVKHYRAGRQRRRILSMLAQLETDMARNSPDALARISSMLRRIALTRFPRTKVAALTGEAWLRFLDESGGNGRFRKGPGRVLASGPYQRSVVADVDVAALSALVHEWVTKNAGARREF